MTQGNPIRVLAVTGLYREIMSTLWCKGLPPVKYGGEGNELKTKLNKPDKPIKAHPSGFGDVSVLKTEGQAWQPMPVTPAPERLRQGF